ncbi:MAG: hypothetical protein AAFN63_01035 [Pseudomonadota bacterium]
MSKSFVNDWSDQERIERAKDLADRLVDHTRGLLALSENNKVVLYSDMLSSQIPRSFAANAFNDLQRSMQFYFLVRLSAIWDKASPDRESIPTVIALLGKPEVADWFVNETYQYHLNMAPPRELNPTTDPAEQRLRAEYWASYNLNRAEKERANVRRWITFATRVVPRVEHSFLAKSLRPFRDRYIAHNLGASVDNKGSPTKLRHGDEDKLLRLTVRIVDRLHLALNGTSFAWDASQEQASRNANELWSNCRFEF